MQNRYAGDVGDYGKFSLLRHLFAKPGVRLGIIWYLFPDEDHNGDGRHIRYLENKVYAMCDIDLVKKLKAIVNGQRSVARLEKSGVLPSDTVFFSECLDFHLRFPSQSKNDKAGRERGRIEWLMSAVDKLSACKAIFLDPDNGLEISTCGTISQTRSGKYAYYAEIRNLANGKETTVIYHHLNRHKDHGSHENQIRTRVVALRKEIAPTGKIIALRFRPYSPRAYFILTIRSSEDRIRESLRNYLAGPCGRLWDHYCEEKSR